MEDIKGDEYRQVVRDLIWQMQLQSVEASLIIFIWNLFENWVELLDYTPQKIYFVCIWISYSFVASPRMNQI